MLRPRGVMHAASLPIIQEKAAMRGFFEQAVKVGHHTLYLRSSFW